VSNVLSEEKKQQVIALGRLGWPLRRIQEATGVRRETATAYLKAVGVAVRPPGAWGRRPPAKPANEVTPDPGGAVQPGPPSPDPPVISKPANGVTPDSGAVVKPDTESPDPPVISEPANEVIPEPGGAVKADTEVPDPPVISKPANQVSPDSGSLPEPNRSPTASACEPYRDFIEISLSKGRNAKAIYQDLADDHGFRGAYQSVKRFVHKLRGHTAAEACSIIVTPPGEESQVDYGTGPMVRDPHSGRYRRTRLFVLTLGYSRKAVRLLTFQSSTRIWAELHEQAFRRLGGVTRLVVLDNLGEGVLKPDIYDPALNPLYRDLLAHYGAVALPCRVHDADRKGKVERSVGHAKNTPLKGLRFESLEEAQTYLDRWERNWADTRIHGTTKRQVAAMFAEEKSALLALPVQPFRVYQFGQRSVNLDGCVEVDAAYYSAPPGWIGRHVDVQWDPHVVRVLDPRTGQLLREHRPQQRGHHRIPDEDKPSRTPRSTQHLLARCQKAGPHLGTLADLMYRDHGVIAIRRIQGLLALGRRHGAALTDDACAAALEIGVPDNPYRFVRRWLERRPQLTLRQVDPIIRQLTLYRDLIDNKTQENPE
jgi:transposase